MKKIIGFILAASFCVSLQAPVMAYDAEPLPHDLNGEVQMLLESIDMGEELQYARMGYIDPAVDQEILDSIEVGTTDPNGDVSYSVRRLGTVGTGRSLNGNNNGEGTMYVVSATKTTRDDNEGYGMEAHLVMGWIDNLGPANELVYVSGSWITGDYTILGRMVDFGTAGPHDEYIESEAYSPTSNTFYYTPENEMVGIKLMACSIIVSEESFAAQDGLYCKVRPTILD